MCERNLISRSFRKHHIRNNCVACSGILKNRYGIRNGCIAEIGTHSNKGSGRRRLNWLRYSAKHNARQHENKYFSCSFHIKIPPI